MMKRIVLQLALVLGLVFPTLGQVKLNEIQTSNSKTQMDPDFYKYKDWVELYNTSSSEVNLGGYYLTDNKDKPRKWQIPSGQSISAKGYMLIYCDGEDVVGKAMHTNFKLSSGGDMLYLYTPTMFLTDSVTIVSIETDYTYGRVADGTGAWASLSEPTPATANVSTVVKGLAPKPNFSVLGGFYSKDQLVTLSSDLQGAVIRYTTDGSEPTEDSPIYEGAITANKVSSQSLITGYDKKNKTHVQHYQWASGDGQLSSPDEYNWGMVNKGFVLKAKVFHPDYVPSLTACQTYFINMSRPSLPIVSVTVDKGSFFSADSGIYIQGTNGIRRGGDGDVTANWNHTDWERKVFVEYFDENGERQFGVNAGAKVMGAISRHSDLKSLNIIMKKKYEDGQINYPLFGSEGLDSYESFILRNSGNDWEQGMFARDAVAQSIVRGQCDLETQGYQPVVMYLNGEYWSIINLRERYDKHYFGGYYDYVDESNIDLLKIDKSKNSFNASEGDSLRYEEMMAYLKVNEMSDEANYEYVKNHYIDVDNMINYYIAQLFCQNTDWPDNNMRLWRPRTENGKFRFPWYDSDFGYGLWGGSASTDPFNNFYEKKKYAPVILFDYMMENDDFKNEFIQRFHYMLNTVYEANRSKEIINDIEDKISNERSISDSKWYRSVTARYSSYLASSVESFAESRVSNMRGFLNSRYGSKGTAKLTVNYTASQGLVQLCGLDVKSGYSGAQYKSTPIRLTAIPNDGYEFVAWQTGTGQNVSTDLEYNLTITGDYTIKAVFTARSTETNLFVNEFLTSNTTDIVSPIGNHEDWIEIYNAGSSSVNLAGLYISDDRTNPTMYQIPYTQLDSTTIGSKGYVLFYADNDYMEGALHLPFKLDKAGGVVILSQKSSNGTVTILDSLHYEKQNVDVSYGRYPDGTKDLTIFTKTTPRATNKIVSGTDIDGLVINEFMAKNETTITEETGTYADWFEIYNTTDEDIDLGGLFVTNSLENPTMYMIPKGEPTKTTIEANGYYVIWCDKQTAINPNHVDFKLSAEQGDIAIVQVRGSDVYVIDQVSYTNQAEDVSYGRYPSVTSDFIYLLNPTPGAANKKSSPVDRITGVTINELLALNTSVVTDETGAYSDYIEIYNGTSAPIDLGGLYISDTLGAPLRYKIPTSNSQLTTVQAGKWLILWADGKPELGENHLGFGLDGLGEDVVLSQLTEDGLVIIDQVSFEEQTANISFGRYPELADNWETMSPTSNAKNQSYNSTVALKSLTTTTGTILPVLSTSILNYECAVPAGTTEVPVISATAAHDKANVTITQAESFNDVATIKVISANGYNSEVYKVSFKIAASSDATLASLVSAGGTMSPAFNPETENYVVNLSTAYIPYVTAIPSNENAMVNIDYAETVSESTIVTVTAEDGSVKDYEITYTLSGVQNVVTEWSDDFSSGIGNLATNNDVHIISEHTTTTGMFPVVTNTDVAVALNQSASDSEYGYVEYHLPTGYVLDGSKALNVSMTVTVPDEGSTVNGVTVKNQYMSFSLALVDAYGNVSNYMSSTVGVDNYSSADTYTVNFGSASYVTKSAIVALRIGLYSPNDETKKRQKALYIDDLVIGPKVASGSSSVVVLSSNADLESISASVGTLSPSFNKDVKEYTLTLPAGTETIPTISAEVADETATLEIAQASDLNGMAYVSVISQDMTVINECAIQLILTPSVVEGYTDYVVQPAMEGWTSNSNMYTMQYNGGDIAVDYNRTSASSDAITYNVKDAATKILDIANYPYASVKMKSTVATQLFVELFDADGTKTSSSIEAIDCEAGNEMITYIFDFTDYLGSVDASNIYGMNIYFDKGSASQVSGTIKIDELRFGSEVEIVINQAPVWTAISEQVISQGGSFDNISLTAKVKDDLTEVSDLVFALENNTENLDVTISNGVLIVSAKDEQWIGSESVKISATDSEGESATITITYTVEELKIDLESILFTQDELELSEKGQVNVSNYLELQPADATIESIVWSVSDKSLASISGLGVLTNTLAYGQEELVVTVTITDKSENVLTKNITVVLTGCPTRIELISLESDVVAMYYGETKQLEYTVYPDDACVKTVSYSSSNMDVATVSADGVITASEGVAGSTEITIMVNDGFSVQTKKCTVTVSKDCSGDIELTLNKSELSLLEGKEAELIATITPDDECTEDNVIEWTSSNDSYVTVVNGIVSAVAEGTATITASTTGNGVTSASCVVTVSRDCVSGAVNVAMNTSSFTMYKSDADVKLSAEITTSNPCDETIVWSSSDEKVLKVAPDGSLAAVGHGIAIVRATAAQDEESYAECEVEVVKKQIEDISVTSAQKRMYVGDNQQVTATISPLDAEDASYTWVSDDETLAIVSTKGIVTALAEGSATIRAISDADNSVYGYCTIQILPVTATSITVSPSEVTLSIGDKQAISVVFEPENTTDKTVEWQSLDESVVTVSDGVITAVDEGETTVVATTSNGITGIVSVVVSPNVVAVESVSVEPSTLNMFVGDVETVAATVLPADATNKSISWSSSNTDVATVSATTGEITAISKGNAVITASSSNGKTAEVAVTVSHREISEVAFEDVSYDVSQDQSISLNDMLVVTPINTEIQSVTWSVNSDDASISDDGVLTNNLAFGTSTVSVTAKVTDMYGTTKTAVVDVVLTGCSVRITDVQLSTTSIVVEKSSSAKISVSTSPVTACVEGIAYQSADVSVVTVSSQGVVTPVAIGETTISVIVSDGFESYEQTVSVSVVNDIIPVTSISIEEGTLLNKSVLDKFQLSVVFEPSDATDKNIVWSSSNTSVATVDTEGNVEVLASGSAVIKATAHNGKTASCQIKASNVPVSEIVLDAERLKIQLNENVQLNAEVNEDATDKTITWSSTNSDVATVDAEGNVVAVGVGTCEIKATAGSVSSTCIVTVSNIMPTSLTLSPETIVLDIDKSEKISASWEPEDATDTDMTWSSENVNIARVSTDGIVTAVAAGSTKIVAKISENEVSATVAVTVNPMLAESVAINPETVTLSVNAQQLLVATVLPEKTTDKSITWSSSDPTKVSVDAKTGKITANALTDENELVEITATTSNGVTDTCYVSVTVYVVPVESITLNPSNLSMKVGDTQSITAEILPSNATNKTVIWESSNPSIATVNQYGSVVGKSVGTTVITAKSGNDVVGTSYVSVQAVEVESISIADVTLAVSEEQVLSASILPSNASDISLVWSVEDESIATINATTGRITGVAEGTTTVRATATNGVVGEASVEVSKTAIPVTSIRTSAKNTTIDVYAQRNLSDLILFNPETATNKSLVWSITSQTPDYEPESATVATIDSKTGVITGVAAGTATVSVRSASNISAQTTMTVTVNPIHTTSITLNETSVEMVIYNQMQLTAQVLPSDASCKTVKWTTDDPNVISISESGVVTALVKGTAYAIATSTERPTVSERCKITVIDEPIQSIVSSESTLTFTTVGEMKGITITVTPDDAETSSIEWTSSDPSVVAIDGLWKENTQCLLVAKAAGTAVITATASGGARCEIVCEVAKEEVNTAPISSPIPAQTLTAGETVTIDLNMYYSDAEGDRIVWTPNANGSNIDCEIDGNGIATFSVHDEDGTMGTQIFLIKARDSKYAESTTSQIMFTLVGKTKPNPQSVSELYVQNLRAYPNPTQGLFSIDIETSGDEECLVEIYSMTGRKVYSNHVSVSDEETIDVDLTGCVKGMYFVVVSTKSERKTIKVVLE